MARRGKPGIGPAAIASTTAGANSDAATSAVAVGPTHTNPLPHASVASWEFGLITKTRGEGARLFCLVFFLSFEKYVHIDESARCSRRQYTHFLRTQNHFYDPWLNFKDPDQHRVSDLKSTDLKATLSSANCLSLACGDCL